MKLIKYFDENGVLKTSLLPDDAPDSDAHLGIPYGINLSGLYPEPFASQLEDALAVRNLTVHEDFTAPGVAAIIQKAIQQVLKLDAHDIIEYVRKNKHDSVNGQHANKTD